MAHVDFMPRQLYNTTMVDKFNVVPGLKTSTGEYMEFFFSINSLVRFFVVFYPFFPL